MRQDPQLDGEERREASALLTALDSAGGAANEDAAECGADGGGAVWAERWFCQKGESLQRALEDNLGLLILDRGRFRCYC